MRRAKRHMDQADQVVGQFGELVKKQYGFVSDPSLPLHQRVEIRIGEMSEEEWSSRPTNMACHNLLRDGVSLPVGTNTLLGLGLNYCIKTPHTRKTTEHTFSRLAEDVRRLYHLRDAMDGDWIPSLYVKSGYKFEPAPEEFEDGLINFKRAIISKQQEVARRRCNRIHRNIKYSKWNLIQFYRKNDQYIVVDGDKNLGPCVLEREYYIYRGCKEHLGNERNYKQLTEQQITTMQRGLQYKYLDFIGKYRPRRRGESPVPYTTISEPEVQFLKRSLSESADKLAVARFTAKVHKDPWKLRPIICCCGTFMNAWSKWLDYWLQKLKPLIPSYVKDYQQVLRETKRLRLPLHARLFAADANSMYNNICTDHAIEVISWWLNDMHEKDKLPYNFPLDAVLSAMVTIMRNNIFKWGDLYFLQLLGTAMGTSAAVMWATLYYAYHEVHTLMPKHGHNLLYFRRFIDDIFGVWIGTTDNEWNAFCEDVDTFGVLTWDIKEQKLSSSVNFLDLTLTIEGNSIVSRTYQKEMNLYLYLPATSAHTPNCIKGTIYGLVKRYYEQNTYRKDYVNFCGLLYSRLIKRGWKREYIRELINQASSTVEARAKCTTVPTQTRCQDLERENLLFIHVQYHPDDITRRQIRAEWDKHCGKLFEEELGLTQQVIVAYSRQKNIRDYVSQAALHQAKGRESSTIMGEYLQDLNS